MINNFNDVLIKEGKSELNKQLNTLISTQEYRASGKLLIQSKACNSKELISQSSDDNAQIKQVNKLAIKDNMISEKGVKTIQNEHKNLNKAVENMVKSHQLNHQSKGIDREIEL